MQPHDGLGKACSPCEIPLPAGVRHRFAPMRAAATRYSTQPLPASASTQRGFSLIEVLVAVLIFGVAVLGIALMQLKGAQFTKQSGARTVAVLQARSLADAMRANPAGVFGVANVSAIGSKLNDLSGSYYLISSNTPPDPTSCGSVAPCIQAKQDLAQWLSGLKNGTPVPTGSSSANVLGAVSVASGTGVLQITSTWSGARPDASGNNINDSYTFYYQPSPQ